MSIILFPIRSLIVIRCCLLHDVDFKLVLQRSNDAQHPLCTIPNQKDGELNQAVISRPEILHHHILVYGYMRVCFFFKSFQILGGSSSSEETGILVLYILGLTKGAPFPFRKQKIVEFLAPIAICFS